MRSNNLIIDDKKSIFPQWSKKTVISIYMSILRGRKSISKSGSLEMIEKINQADSLLKESKDKNTSRNIPKFF